MASLETGNEARDIVLAIDDSPERYPLLAQKLRPHSLLLVCVAHPTSVEMILNSGRVGTILLDHDMPNYEYDDHEGRMVLKEDHNGQFYARTIIGRYRKNQPAGTQVLISSANPSGSLAISKILKEASFPHHIMSVVESCPEERWLGAILDKHYTSNKER